VLWQRKALRWTIDGVHGLALVYRGSLCGERQAGYFILLGHILCAQETVENLGFLAKTIFEASHLVSPVFNLRRPTGVPAEASMKINAKTINTIKCPPAALK
jgi:hypothetical protein